MERSFWSKVLSKVLHSRWVSLFLFLIGFIASYLEFAHAGWTLFFLVLCGLTIIAALLAAIPLGLKWFRGQKRRAEMARLYYDHWQRVEMLKTLVKEFTTLEKAKCLADAIKENVRVVAILPVADRRVGVMLNTGEEEDLQVGTRLLVYRIDHYTPDGQHIEQPLALVQVTYVQAENNCSQAVVLDWLDPEFWDQATTQLKQEKHIDPPRNFAVPYIPEELRSLSLEDLTTFRQYLETIHDSLTRIEPDQVVHEEGLQ